MEFLSTEEEIKIMLDGKTFEEYRREKIQEQAEYLVKREMERMRKKAGLKELLPYIPEVKVLSKEEWLKKGKENVGGYINNDNQVFLPEDKFRGYDLWEYDLLNDKERKFLYRKNDEIVEIIKHELTHLFVRNEFKSDDVFEIDNDASPIFLYFLAFFNGAFGTGNKVQAKYKDEVKEQIKGLSFMEVRDICIKLIANIEMILCSATFTTDSEKTEFDGKIIKLGYDICKYNFNDYFKLLQEMLKNIEKQA